MLRLYIHNILRILREMKNYILRDAKSEIDAETEIHGMHLRIARFKNRQQGVVGEEANVLTSHAEGSVQFEESHTGPYTTIKLFI